MKNILVTGVAGNIGSCLANKLLEKKFRVIGIDNFVTGFKKNLPKHKNFRFYRLDINNANLEKKLKNYKIDYIFHFAAYVGVKNTLNNPLMVLSDIEGIKKILQFSIRNKVKKFFYSSSSEVYGEPVSLPLNEKITPLNSRLPYAVVKNIGENFIKSYNKEYGLKYVIFRIFNTYGPNQSQDFVIPNFIERALNELPIKINGDGKQSRTFMYIDDNINAIYNTLMSNKFNLTLNIGSNREYNINQVAKKIILLTKSNSKILHLKPLKEGDMFRRKPDLKNMRKIYKKKLIDLDSGIKKIIKLKLHN